MKKKKRFRVGISLFLAVLVFLSGFMGYKGVEAAGAMDRVKTYIALGAGKNSIDETEIKNLNKEELQFLGIYISNFFVPFRTNVGIKGDEDTISLKKDITENLKNVLGFNDILANQFGELLFSLIRGSSKTLDLTFQKDNPSVTGNIVEVSPKVRKSFFGGFLKADYKVSFGGIEEAGKQKASYAALLASVFSTKSNYDQTFGEDGWNEAGDAKYRYAVFYNQDSKTPVFVADLLGEEVTASEFVFLKGLQESGVADGYGFSLFDLGKNEIEEPSQSVFTQILEKTSGKDLSGYSIFGGDLRVDCFGNLMYLGSNNQYIIMSGASNPFTWVPVDKTGNDFPNVGAGRFVNMTNLMSLDLMARGDLFSSSYPAKEKVNAPSGGNVSEKSRFIVGKVDGTNSDVQIDVVRTVDSEIASLSLKYNQKGTISLNKMNGLASLILKDRDDWGGISHNIAEGNVKTKFFEGSLDNLIFKGTQAQAEKLARGFYDSYDVIKNESSGKLSEINIFKEVADKVRTQNNNSQELEKSEKTTTEGSNNYWGTGVVSFDRLKSFLVGHEDGSDYLLSISRGFNKVEGDDPFIGESSMAKFFNKAMANESGGVDSSSWFASSIINVIDPAGMRPRASIVGGKSYLDGRNGKTVNFYDSYALIDDLGAFGWGTGNDKDIDYQAINFSTILDKYDVNKTVNQESSTFIGDIVKNLKDTEAFSNSYKSISEGGVLTVDKSVFSKVGVSLYVTYAYASFADSGNKAETYGKAGFRLNKEGLPQPEKGVFSLDSEAVEDMQIKAIRDWVYYLLHPTEGFKYVFTLVKNTVNSVLVGLHEDITGSRGTGITAGTTKYKSSFGLVSLPEVSETEWMNGAIRLYDKLMIYMILAAVVFAVVYWAVGVLEAKKALSGLAVAVAVIILIPSLLVNSISWSNKVISAPFSQRFNHWALVQHQTYSSELDKEAESGNYTQYLRRLNQNNLGLNQGGDPVNVKWQAPKKMASLMFDVGESRILGSDTSLGRMIGGTLNRAYSGEGYLDDKDSVYMFRNYLDLSNSSRYIYGSIKDGKVSFNDNPNTSLWSDSLRESYNSLNKDLDKARRDGYINSSEGELAYRLKSMLGAKPYNDTLSQKGTIKDLSMDDLVGLSPNAFNFSIPMFTKGLKMSEGDSTMQVYKENWPEAANYSDADIASLGIYGIFSESPYYYFSFSLYDQGLGYQPGTSGGYKDLILEKQNAGYFYNNTANGNGLGEMKDFLDMRGLFTYVIPYLKQGNDIVREWDSIYGTKLYEGVSTKEEDLVSERMSLPENAELRQKTWHNVNVSRLYSIYTPWVDLMYDSKYAKPVVVTVLGERVEILDPLDPKSYPEDRPMVFSRSEQLNMGYKDGDLTDVERKIIEIQEKSMSKMYDLLDYYAFNDNVMNSAVAMELTFIFNREFSDLGVLNRGGIMLYPQNYEMTDFSHDAYLRLILANSTGESLYEVKEEGFYKGIVDQSNSLVALMLIITDVAGQYVLPVMKLLTLIGLLVLAFLIAITVVVRIKDKPFRYGLENWLTPLIKFLVYTIIFSYAIALFMPVGSGIVSKHSFSIRLGDPTVAMGILTVLIGVMCWLYFKILKEILKSVRDTSFGIGSLVAATVSSAVRGGGALGMGFVGGKVSNPANFVKDKKREFNKDRDNRRKARQMAEEKEKYDKEKEKKQARNLAKEDNKSTKKGRDFKSRKDRIENRIKNGSKKLGSNPGILKTPKKVLQKGTSKPTKTVIKAKPPKERK